MFIDCSGSPVTLNQISTEDLHKETAHNVSWGTYLFYSSMLVALSPLIGAAKISLFVTNFFRRKDTEYSDIQDHIQKYASKHHTHYASEDLMELTQRIHTLVEPKLKPIILDLVAMEKGLSHIHPILQGANVEVVSDKGYFFHSWKVSSNATQRQCSHRHDRDLAYSIRGSLFNEFLFWKDKDTHSTRFQLEANSIHNPFMNFSSVILHLRDYLNYKRSGLQQSQFGESPFTENNPIRIVFDKEVFLKNKEELQKEIELIKENKSTLS